MKRKGRIVVLHLAIRYPFAGVVWQLLHHLIGLRALGLDVYYIEDHGAYVYDAVGANPDRRTPTNNLKLVGGVLDRFGFAGRWGFLDPITQDYVGMPKDKCLEADPRIRRGAQFVRRERATRGTFRQPT